MYLHFNPGHSSLYHLFPPINWLAAGVWLRGYEIISYVVLSWPWSSLLVPQFFSSLLVECCLFTMMKNPNSCGRQGRGRRFNANNTSLTFGCWWVCLQVKSPFSCFPLRILCLLSVCPTILLKKKGEESFWTFPGLWLHQAWSAKYLCSKIKAPCLAWVILFIRWTETLSWEEGGLHQKYSLF